MESEERKTLDRLDSTVTKILFHLESDPRTNTKGLVEKFGIMEEQIKDLLTRERIYKAKAGVYGIFGGAALWLIKEFISKIIP